MRQCACLLLVSPLSPFMMTLKCLLGFGFALTGHACSGGPEDGNSG